MKKFRLFTLLAIVATISTSFAAWTYYNNASKAVESDKFSIVMENPDNNVVEESAIELEITSAEMPKVEFVQKSNSMDVIPVVTGDVEVEVSSAVGAEELENYSYYYTIYTKESSLDSNLPNLKRIDYYETDGTVNDYGKLKEITILDGKATISEEELVEFFEVDQSDFDKSTQAKYENSLMGLKGNIQALENAGGGVYLKFYAKAN
ncbi:MAG: hypothetical protein IJN27_06305 [Oscillospiraceae bacterium]|nr:hypothetical protein [Oscillospiraceae bacterium]